MSRLTEDSSETLMGKLLDLFQYIPLTESASKGVAKFIQVFSPLYPHSELELEE